MAQMFIALALLVVVFIYAVLALTDVGYKGTDADE